MAETLGEKLRAAREERGVSVSEVAEQTRIAPMYIECIENDNYKPLPGGIFNKGFVKSYARFIGYDENQALQEYSQLMAQMEGTTAEEQFRTYRPEVLTDDRASQSTVSTIIFAGIILALMTGAVYLLANYLLSPSNPEPVATNTAPANQAAQPEQPAATPAPAGNAPTMQYLRVEFRSLTEPISLSATSDGQKSINTVTPGNPQIFEPKQSLTLSYAKTLAASAQLFINGRQITLPSQPANPKRIPIEIEISATNLPQIWETGQISFGTAPPAAPVTAPTPAQTQPPAAGTPATSTPRPAASPTVRRTPAPTNTPRPTPTPIIIRPGRPTPRPN